MLVGAMAAARSGSRSEADAFLRYAAQSADRIGQDANHVWTAFGPTNVAMHRVSAAAELGDMQRAAHLASTLDVDSMLEKGKSGTSLKSREPSRTPPKPTRRYG